MKAWHFVGTNQPFERVEIEEPTPGPDKVIIDVQATMKYMASGDLSPLITEIGFEEIADGVRQLQEGTTTGRLVAKLAD